MKHITQLFIAGAGIARAGNKKGEAAMKNVQDRRNSRDSNKEELARLEQAQGGSSGGGQGSGGQGGIGGGGK